MTLSSRFVKVRGVVLSLIAIAKLAAAASAAQAAASPAQTTANIPDLNGVWAASYERFDGRSVATPQRGDLPDLAPPPESLPKLKGKYAEVSKADKEKIAKGWPVADLGAACIPEGLATFWGGPFFFEIVQTPHQINVFQEYNEQTRRIYLDGRGHPENYDPSYKGHSTGRWEANDSLGVPQPDTLVIDTVSFNTKTFLNSALGMRHSDKMHVTERVRVASRDLIEVIQVIEDPEALAEPLVTSYFLRRQPAGAEVGEYVCAENNRNPVNASGFTEAVLEGDKK